MATSFDALKKNRTKSLDKLNDQLSKLNTKTSYADPDADKYWNPTKDSAGNGMAIIRFLDAPEGEDMPFVRIWDHGFQGPTGKWYIEKSLTTIGQPDPLSDINSKLWNSGNESDKEQARKQKRRLKYVSNIYVVKDSGNPENDGKVFLYAYGKKIFDKLNDLMNPSFEDETPVNPFDMWSGANFRLKIRQVEGYSNYDKSEFDSPSPLFDDDDEIEAVWKKEYSLQELLNPSKYKSFDELTEKLNSVLELTGTTRKPVNKKVEEETLDEDLDVSAKLKSSPQKEEKSVSSKMDDDDDDLEYFKNLAKS